MKSGNLNFLEPSGPLQACNGTALPLPLPLEYCQTNCANISTYIKGVPGGEVNILGGHSIGHSNQKTLYEHVSYSERFPRYSHLTE
jgi:hypothetical protein